MMSQLSFEKGTEDDEHSYLNRGIINEEGQNRLLL